MLRKVGPNEVLRCKIGTVPETIFPWTFGIEGNHSLGIIRGAMLALCSPLLHLSRPYVGSAIPFNPKRLGWATDSWCFCQPGIASALCKQMR